LLIVDELGCVPLSKSGAKLLREVFKHCSALDIRRIFGQQHERRRCFVPAFTSAWRDRSEVGLQNASQFQQFSGDKWNERWGCTQNDFGSGGDELLV
jgi:hypothetical protein